jgi:hypothetical protein
MFKKIRDPAILNSAADTADGITARNQAENLC